MIFKVISHPNHSARLCFFVLTFTSASLKWQQTPPPATQSGCEGLRHTNHNVQTPLTGLTCLGRTRTTVPEWWLLGVGVPEVQLTVRRCQVARAEALVLQPLCTPSRQHGYEREVDSKRWLRDEAEPKLKMQTE